jgi:O-antigen/teichoic acid export membrane protein
VLDTQSKLSLIGQTYKNIISGWLSILLVAVVSIVLTPVVLNNAGKELYGLWFLVFNVMSYFYIADFGITSAITRLYAKYNINNKLDAYKLISTSYLLVLLIDVIVVLVILNFSEDIYKFLEIKSKYFQIFSTLLLIAVFELFTQFILRVNIGVLKGKHRYDIAYNLEGLSAALRLTAILLLLILDSFTIVTFALAYSLSKIFSDALSFYYIKEDIKGFQFSFDANIFRELFDIGSSSLLTSIASALYNSLPLLLFGKFFGVDKVFIYSIPFAIMIILTRLINAIYHGVTPRSSELKELGGEVEIEKISSFGVKISAVLGFSFLCFFIIFGESLLHMWLGDKILDENDYIFIYNILIILLIYLFVSTLQKVNIFIYKSTGFHWLVTYETIISVFLLYLCSYILFDYIGMYVFSVALVIVGIFKYIFYKSIARNKITTYSLSFASLILSVFYLLFIYIVNDMFSEYLVIKLLFFIVTMVIYLALIYKYIFNHHEKDKIKQQFFQIMRKIA